MIISVQRIVFTLSALFYFIILCGAYVYFVSPIFSYGGYALNPNWVFLTISVVVIVILSLIISLDKERPSSYFVLLYIGLFLIPFLVYWSLNNQDGYYAGVVIAAFVTMIFILRLPDVHLYLRIENGKPLFFITFFLLFLSVSFIAISRGGLNLVMLDVKSVYDIRGDIHSSIFYGFSAYLKEWLGKSFVPIFLAYAFYKKSWTLILMGISAALFLTFITTAKEFVAYIFVVGGIYFLFSNYKNVFSLSLIGLCLIIISAFTYNAFNPELSIISAVVLQRTFFSPAFLHFEYYNFFQDNELVYLSNTALSFLSDYPYDAPVPAILGFGLWQPGQENFANTGVFATGYMHFGTVGVFVFAILLALIFKTYDILIRNNIPVNFAVAASSASALQFINGDLLTAMLSHGVGLNILMLILFIDRKNPISNSS